MTHRIEPVHPIEAASYRILAERIDLSHFAAGPRAVIERVIHASADLDYAHTMLVSEQAVDVGVAAIRAGEPVVTDGETTRAGITGVSVLCYLNEVSAAGDVTRSARAMRLAAERHPVGAIVVIGSAPTALEEALSLAADGRFAPALVIGLPVGFVGAAAAKEAARASGRCVITNTGEKGGSAAAAAACNAIVRLAHG
ncbi:MAG TPA: precorrin-8X methylmutase [Acidimicrobiales bacterium]|nr:precorrin-8X methylmutase [Acidimicrobiales bacterium]